MRPAPGQPGPPGRGPSLSHHGRRISSPAFLPRKKFSPQRIPPRPEFFPSRKYLCISPAAGEKSFSEEKTTDAQKYFAPKPKHGAINSLSTKKVTGNYQNPPEFCLTGYDPISISCGQGSGHPHPVVVDNVLESFGNFPSPRLFARR